MGERRRDGEASDDEVIELETAGGHETEVIELDDDSDEEVKVAQKKKESAQSKLLTSAAKGWKGQIT